MGARATGPTRTFGLLTVRFDLLGRVLPALRVVLTMDSRHYVSALTADLQAEWRKRAACRSLHRLMADEDEERQAEAKEVCRNCPVLKDCQIWVFGLPQDQDPGGVTGAYTERERWGKRLSAKARRRMRLQKEAAEAIS